MLRRVGVTLVLTMLVGVAASLPLRGAAAQTGGDTVTATGDGWWSQSNRGVESPVGGFTPPLPRSPLVPQGSLPVAATFGEPQSDAAIAIVVPEGMQATRLVMTLAIAEGSGAESNAAQAALQACPIVSFWGSTENGKWEDRPEADCSKAAVEGLPTEGERSWSFDLTPIAELWADEFESIGQNGVLITESASPPATFQIAFAGVPGGVTFDAELAPKPSSSSAFDVPVASGDGGFVGGGSFDPTPTFDASPLPTTPVAVPPPATPRPAAPRQQEVGQLAASRSDGDLLGDLPLGLVLLVPAALVLAAMASQALSPVGARTERVRRQGGVGKALAARTAAPARRPRTEPT